MDWAKATARLEENLLSFGSWYAYIKGFTEWSLAHNKEADISEAMSGPG